MKPAALHTAPMPRSELQGLLDAAVDAILVIDHRGVVTTFNASAERIFGYTAAEVLGRNVSMLMPEPYRSAHDGYLARYAAHGVPHIIGTGREIEARRKDGSTFPAHLSVGQVPGGEPAQYVGFIRDITPQREALSSLRHERDRANGYLELFPHALMTLDDDGAITAVNEHACSLLQASEHELLGRTFLVAAIAPADRARVETAFSAMREDLPAGRRTQFSTVTPDPRARTIDWRCLRVDEGFHCAGEDITESLQREAERRDLQSRLTHVARFATMGELASGIAHEVNQPLAAIANYARAAQRFLSRPEPDLAETRLALEETAAEALRAGDIIRRLRGLIDGKRGERVPTDVNALVHDLEQLASADARAHGTQLHVELGGSLPPVLVNPAELQHVLLNLTRNALEALSRNPSTDRHVHVSTRMADGKVEIRVADNGPGVDGDMSARLFEPFATSKPYGTGLGLAIGRSLVKSNGGTIDYSAAEPQGACFCIRLPPTEEPLA